LVKQLLTLSAVLLLCSQPSAAQEKRNLRVAYVSPSYSQSINWIAKETGIFSKHGLNVELIYMSGGKSTQALVAGSIDFFIECRTAAGASGFGGRRSGFDYQLDHRADLLGHRQA
jgi:ABC-type nitrate/sulfonate/bicarbonate transport system substrate-binding protein